MLMKASNVEEILKLIANKYRLLILCQLEEGAKNVSQIHECCTNITMAALSQHLNVLKHAGIVSSSKEGLHVTYQIADGRILNIIRVIRENYC